MTIGVLLNDLHNPFFADIAGGIEALASELGYQLLLGTGRRQPERERTVVTSFADYRVDGLILVSPRLDDADLAAAARSIPTVVTGRELDAPEIDTLAIDEPLGVRAVVSYLAGLGHTEILHVTGGDGAGAATRAAVLPRDDGGRRPRAGPCHRRATSPRRRACRPRRRSSRAARCPPPSSPPTTSPPRA